MKKQHAQLKNVLLGASLLALLAAPQAMGRTSRSSTAALDNAAKSEILARHNEYRAAVNSPALKWSSELERDAHQWAQYLAKSGGRRIFHASAAVRNGQGENLWIGTAGSFSRTTMVNGWGKGRQYFRPGTFPNVSTTGNWTQVGHYSQIVWKSTTKIGCAQSRAGGNDILVCRYDPAGNIVGRRVY